MRINIARSLLLGASALLLASSPTRAVTADDADSVATQAPAEAAPAAAEELLAAAASLRPGEFAWQPGRAPSGSVEIVVSIPLQRAYVYRAGTLIGVTTVSTGRRGHPTPTGTFAITQKRRQHFSNLYANAPMPFMQRLTNDGIALHAGQIPGHPASHGCVRLPLAFARTLFEATALGTSVHITDRSPAPSEALAMVRGNGAHQGMGGPLEDVPAPRQPSRSAAGATPR